MMEMGLSFDMLRNMTKLGVNLVVDRWEMRRWREGLIVRQRCGYIGIRLI